MTSKVCTKCHGPIDGRDYYSCQYNNACECILHPQCYQEAKDDNKILLKCKCHFWHIESFVYAKLAEDTSEEEQDPKMQEPEQTHEIQEHPEEMIWYLSRDANAYVYMKRSEALRLQEIDDSKGIPRSR
jgi:hypothetical protein